MIRTPLLQVRDLTVRRGQATVLHEVSLTVTTGSRHVLTGANGAGKTSLLHAVAGTLRPAAGQIILAGRDITGLPAHRIARLGVARTWQHPALCEHLTVADNITLATRTRANQQHGEAVLEQAGLAQHADTIAGRLSYGQRRRLEMAVTLAAQPRLLLLDEPSAGLAAADMRRLVAMLTTSADQITVLLTDHDGDLIAAVADQVSVIEHGRLISNWPPRPPQPTAPGNAVLPSPTRAAPVHRSAPALDVRLPATAIRSATSLDLRIHPGEIVGLAGPNGAGKTTLLHMIAGLSPTPPQAQITLHGKPIGHLSAAQRAGAGLTLLPQDRRLFNALTVADNLRIPTRAHTDALDHALDLFAVLRNRMHQRTGTLSGGEQQLLAIARAISSRPTALLLDEPFEGLDLATIAVVRQRITDLAAAGTAVLITEHHQAGADLAHRTITVNGSPTQAEHTSGAPSRRRRPKLKR